MKEFTCKRVFLCFGMNTFTYVKNLGTSSTSGYFILHIQYCELYVFQLKVTQQIHWNSKCTN